MGSSALGEGYATHGVIDDALRPETLSTQWVWPWATRSWGKALGPAVKRTAHLSGTPFGFVWTRDFENGQVIVNPNSSARDECPGQDATFIEGPGPAGSIDAMSTERTPIMSSHPRG
jgi:hypothetical protein